MQISQVQDVEDGGGCDGVGEGFVEGGLEEVGIRGMVRVDFGLGLGGALSEGIVMGRPWLPAGFSLLGGMYASPYFSFSSSWTRSMYAIIMASSSASFCSAFVRKPLLFVPSISSRSRSLLVPLAQPFVTAALLAAASAMTFRIS